MPITAAQSRASAKYNKSHTKQYNLRYSLQYDADIIEALDAIPNKQGYIKALIRADIAARAKSEPTQPAQNILKEDKTMTYNAVTEPNNLFFDHDPARVIIRDDQPARNPDDPGVPSGGNPWYAVLATSDDDWSRGSFDLDEAKSMAREIRKKHPGAMIAVIDNSLDYPFCSDTITDFGSAQNIDHSKEGNQMKKWIIVDNCLSSKGEIYTERAESREQAFTEAVAAWKHLGRHDQGIRDGFYIGFAEIDEDGNVDFDSMTDIEDIRQEG